MTTWISFLVLVVVASSPVKFLECRPVAVPYRVKDLESKSSALLAKRSGKFFRHCQNVITPPSSLLGYYGLGHGGGGGYSSGGGHSHHGGYGKHGGKYKHHGAHHKTMKGGKKYHHHAHAHHAGNLYQNQTNC